MASEMVERVARAMCVEGEMNEDDPLGGWIHWVPEARAAIEAMQEPTDAMIESGSHASVVNYDGNDPAEVWRLMIDAALKDT